MCGLFPLRVFTLLIHLREMELRELMGGFWPMPEYKCKIDIDNINDVSEGCLIER